MRDRDDLSAVKRDYARSQGSLQFLAYFPRQKSYQVHKT